MTGEMHLWDREGHMHDHQRTGHIMKDDDENIQT